MTPDQPRKTTRPRKPFFPPPRKTTLAHKIYGGFLAALIVVVSAVFLLALPPRFSPVKPLDLDSHSGPFAGVKLSSLRNDPGACARTIARSKMKAEPIPDKKEGQFCAFDHALNVTQSFYPYSQPLRTSCPLAAALYLWEREVVGPAAARHLGSTVVRIEEFGTYSCRRMYGGNEGRVSEHATANAIDISGFTLANGDVILVDKQWRGDTPEAAFLHEVRDRGCTLFQTVLSPDYNAAHHNHLHFDMGPYKLCR
jgi:hypothetical protein